MPEKITLDQAKRILKRVPGIQRLNKIRNHVIQIQWLSAMVKEGKTAVFDDYCKAGAEVEITRPMYHEVVKEWLDLYGIIRLRSATASALDSKAGSSLLWCPLALLKIPASHEEYLRAVERETRRLINLSEKNGYEFREFCWNDYLDDIYEINTSKEFRQSERMRGWYREPVQPRYETKEELQYKKYYGAFKDGKLYAYYHFFVCGDFGVGKHFIGHADHLKFGITNGLISFAVRDSIKNSRLRWLVYGEWERKGSLNAFKQHSGFQGYAIMLDLDSDRELLKVSKEKVRSIWRI